MFIFTKCKNKSVPKFRNEERKFIFLIGEYTSTSKFPHKEKELIKSIVASLTIKGVPDLEIIKVIFNQTGKTITDRYLSTKRQQIKRESYHWYSQSKGR